MPDVPSWVIATLATLCVALLGAVAVAALMRSTDFRKEVAERVLVLLFGGGMCSITSQGIWIDRFDPGSWEEWGVVASLTFGVFGLLLRLRRLMTPPRLDDVLRERSRHA